jgi:hypothetical protein
MYARNVADLYACLGVDVEVVFVNAERMERDTRVRIEMVIISA